MFGFVLPSIPDLSAAERARCEAFYCGVCRSIQDRYGEAQRLAVSYDMTFLAMLLGSLYEPVEHTDKKRCLAGGGKLKPFIQTEFSDYAADLSIVLAYHKLLDDWRDEHSPVGGAGTVALGPAYRKAKARVPVQCGALEASLERIHGIESSPEAFALDAAANAFGAAFGVLYAPKDDFWATDLRRFGARLGKFVYAMDAAVDLEEDRESGSYNPFVAAGIAPDALAEGLRLLAASTADAFERLPLERDVNVLRSVLYAGVWQRYQAKENEQAHG